MVKGAITRQAETPGVCFPMRLVGFFKSIESERWPEWRFADFLSLCHPPGPAGIHVRYAASLECSRPVETRALAMCGHCFAAVGDSGNWAAILRSTASTTGLKWDCALLARRLARAIRRSIASSFRSTNSTGSPLRP